MTRCKNCGLPSAGYFMCYPCERIASTWPVHFGEAVRVFVWRKEIERLTKAIGQAISFAPPKEAQEGLEAVRQLAELATPEKMR